MRKLARLVGLTWMALAAIAVCTLLVDSVAAKLSSISGFHLLIPALLVCLAPGAMLFSWGRGPYVRPRTAREALRPKAPYAADPSHVLRIDPLPEGVPAKPPERGDPVSRRKSGR